MKYAARVVDGVADRVIVVEESISSSSQLAELVELLKLEGEWVLTEHDEDDPDVVGIGHTYTGQTRDDGFAVFTPPPVLCHQYGNSDGSTPEERTVEA